MKASDFLSMMREKRKLVSIDSKLVNRSVNEGFSGGERKRNEIFQMAMLEPSFCILDETDSGLDVDALRIVAEGFNKLRKPDTSAIIITHYQRLLDYITPDVVHVLLDGHIVKTTLLRNKRTGSNSVLDRDRHRRHDLIVLREGPDR